MSARTRAAGTMSIAETLASFVSIICGRPSDSHVVDESDGRTVSDSTAMTGDVSGASARLASQETPRATTATAAIAAATRMMTRRGGCALVRRAGNGSAGDDAAG